MVRRLAIIALLVLCAHSSGLAAGEETAFYVAPEGNDSWSGRSPDEPLRTLERARGQIRSLKAQGDLKAPVVVYLRGGNHFRTEPFLLTPLDSGTATCPVTYRAYPSEAPVIHGGRLIEGWSVEADGRWQVKLPDVATGSWSFRQLYVNGELRRRARTPNQGFLRVKGFPDGGREVHYHTDCQRFEFASGDIDPNWTNLEDVEVIVYHFWTDSHLPIQSIDTRSNVVTFKHKAGKVFTDDFTDAGARYIVENVLEALDQPGEWYLDRKTGVLSYLPLPGETPENSICVAPVLPAFVRLEGDPLNRELVKHIHFDGLSFLYTNWELPAGNSNDRQGAASVPAGISLVGAQHCSFRKCTLAQLGTSAFEIQEGSSFNRFSYNEIGPVAGSGFRVNGGTEKDHPLLRTRQNQITDNHLHHYGAVYPSAVGILLMNTEGNLVAHNHVHHGFYTGISLGWIWGYQRSISRDNVIAYNHIHDIGQGLLSDMGAIYTLGVSPGTVIRNNLIHDIESNHYGGWGIYNDEGSSHILIENNIVFRTKFSAYNIHYAKELTVRNNIFALGRINQLSRGKVDPHKSVFFENNIVYWKEGDLLLKNWKDRTYEFHFHPKNTEGRRPVESTFDMDYNLYYNPGLSREDLRFAGETFEEWKARGKDVHSLFADPLFVDPENGDFRLKSDSPAYALGFRPIDMSKVGPRVER